MRCLDRRLWKSGALRDVTVAAVAVKARGPDGLRKNPDGSGEAAAAAVGTRYSFVITSSIAARTTPMLAAVSSPMLEMRNVLPFNFP